MLKYLIVKGKSANHLEQEMNDWLSKDWRPVGGPFVCKEIVTEFDPIKMDATATEVTLVCQAISKSY